MIHSFEVVKDEWVRVRLLHCIRCKCYWFIFESFHDGEIRAILKQFSLVSWQIVISGESFHSLDPEAPTAIDSSSNGSEGIAQIQLNELSLHEGRSIVHPMSDFQGDLEVQYLSTMIWLLRHVCFAYPMDTVRFFDREQHLVSIVSEMNSAEERDSFLQMDFFQSILYDRTWSTSHIFIVRWNHLVTKSDLK